MSKLTPKELEGYKAQLLSLRTRLTDGIAHIKGETLNQSTRDQSGDLSGYSLHMADQASDNYDREFLLNLADNEREVLHKIDEALTRIKDDLYGVCEECEKPIPKQRLKAMPFATLCVACKESTEKNSR